MKGLNLEKGGVARKGKDSLLVTCFICMDPMSPSPSSNSTSSESQKLVDPSFTRNAMLFPPYLQGVLQTDNPADVRQTGNFKVKYRVEITGFCIFLPSAAVSPYSFDPIPIVDE
jgi:hypothetical protein